MKHSAQPPQSQSQSPNPVAKSVGGNRSRVISSCLTCRRRKVKCDQVHSICGACTRGNHVCTWSEQAHVPGQAGSSGRVSKAAKSENVYSRLERLEQLLVRAVADQDERKTPTMRHHSETTTEEQHHGTPSSNSQTSHGSGVTSGDGEGILILDGGQSQFVSSLHYALLAEEIQDIKALIGDKTDEEQKEIPQHSLVDLLSLGRAGAGSDLEQLMPETQEYCDTLLDLYFSNVDPLIGITHKPTLLRKFSTYNREMRPIVFAIYFSAIKSLPPSAVISKFGESKVDLLARFQLGVEISLARENYLTTTNLEVFQGFLLWLACITIEEDMGKAWVLLGIAIRVALNQGLHQDPSLFSADSMDAVTIESRRRLWHALCHLDFRAAECKGQEPGITEDSYTTLLPRNVNDEDLIEGASPEPTPYDEPKFTTQSFPVSLYSVMKVIRRVIQSTYRLERRMMDAELHGTPRPVLLRELQDLYKHMKSHIEETKVALEQKILRFCTTDTPVERIAGRMVLLMEWRCHLLFWLRLPRDYRGIALGEDLRTKVFEQSITCIENLNESLLDPACAHLNWHLGGLAFFQALTHVLSELRNPLFDVPDRQRAMSALQTRRMLESRSPGKAWQACRNMIDKAVAEYKVSLESASQRPRSHASSGTKFSASPSSNVAQSKDRLSTYSGTLDSRRSFSAQAIPNQFVHQPQPAQSHHFSLTASMSQPDLPSQRYDVSSWDMFNQSNISSSHNTIGKEQIDNHSAPSFDFGFWGDPFQFQNDPSMMNMNMDMNDLQYPWFE